ncbi:Daunorubicin/doxorubicin resistance ATP-binding protein DrrA [Adhaeretor mobilis]|uniref:Daunorubicin/doxorubicin resistance ATP-binding protein DrrA n=2 Tax=Adhaeretor mobilis TaxID=1930276 RepID=A0A517MXD0_9BACT|nr:Daunorubicin/doxorubicin resistance ATP-binding protein DrrA [Adhaeretor mobilis]
MLKFDQVTRTYGDRVAVDRLCLDIQAGELFALLGHNGAGKTTTIKTLVGLLRPTSGTVTVGPYNVTEQSREASRLVGYVPDQPFLYDKLSGREFLHFVASMYGLSDAAAKTALEREAERFQLVDFLDRLTESYSHGMRQRTVFAAAMIHEPQVLVVDEPMVGLDPHSIRLVKDLLRNYVDAGKTVFMSTHTLNVAEEIADRIGVMKAGHKLFDGPVDELKSRMPDSSESLENLYLALMEGAGANPTGEMPVAKEIDPVPTSEQSL